MSRYAIGRKLYLNTSHFSCIFYAEKEEWDYAIPLKFPYLMCSVEYNGFLIAMPLFGEAEVVAYNLDSFGLTNSEKRLDHLQEIFKDPFYNPIECYLTSLDDHGRMCLLYSGFSSSNSSKEFWGRVAVFQVSVSNSTDNPVVTAVLEAVEDYNMQDFVVRDTSIYSTFIMYDDLSMDDTEADARLTNSTLSGLDSRRGVGKHAVEFVTDAYMHKKPKTTVSETGQVLLNPKSNGITNFGSFNFHIKRNGGSFNFVFSPATETKMKNIYQGMIQGLRKATYHLMTEVEALNWSSAIQFPIDQNSIYLLKADWVYKLENDLYMVFTDPVEDTLHSYVKKNEKNLLDPNTGEATQELKMIL